MIIIPKVKYPTAATNFSVEYHEINVCRSGHHTCISLKDHTLGITKNAYNYTNQDKTNQSNNVI